MPEQYNLRSPAVRRLMREAQELRNPTEHYYAQPLDDNLFEWHFTIRGPGDTEFDGGFYHGRIILPADYPMKPPSIIFLTANGRFETHTKICLSISKHHPETWQPSWSIRTALLAIIGFMPTPGKGSLGALDFPEDERKKLAASSKKYKCESCGDIIHILEPITSSSEDTKQEIENLASQLSMAAEKQKESGDSPDKEVTQPFKPVNPTPVQPSTIPTTQTLLSQGDNSELRHRSVPDRHTPAEPTGSEQRIPDTQRDSSQHSETLVRSRSCVDVFTQSVMIIVALFLALLILRRVVLASLSFAQ